MVQLYIVCNLDPNLEDYNNKIVSVIVAEMPEVVLAESGINFFAFHRCKDRRAWKICYISLLWLVVAVTLWISDRINCTFWLHVDFPYLHSLWHIFIFLSCYLACVLCAYLYAMQEAPSELKPQICYWPVNSFEHGVPYVHITPPSTKFCP